MLVGHFAVGMAAKRFEPKLSLGTVVFAAMAADFLWCIFIIAGIDQVTLKPGRGAAIILYTRATRPKNSAGFYAFWIAAALLTLIWYNNVAGPPPPSVRALPFSNLIFFSLVVAWAYWMNRARPVRV